MIKTYIPGKEKKSGIGLALGGGGARGLSHLRILQLFDRLKLKPSIISGTSIGALIGGLYAAGLSGNEIESEFREIDLLKAGSLFDLNFKAVEGLIKGRKIEKLIKKKGLKKSFNELEIPLKVVATDFWGGKEKVMDSGPVYKAVRASISIAGIFEPLRYSGQILIDGGYVNPVPYDIIKNQSYLTVAVDVTGSRLSDAGEGEKPSIFENIISAFQITQDIIVKNKMSVSPPDIYVRPDLKNIGVLEFNRIDYILKEAEKDIPRLKELLSDIL